MILGFTQQINNKPTHFVEKIWTGLIYKGISSVEILKNEFQKELVDSPYQKPKLHTIREDKTDRWKPGTMIDFFINVRKPNMFRFAPRVPVVSVQKIDINWCDNPYNDNLNPVVWIDDLIFYDKEFSTGEDKMRQLAINDGFETTEDFFAYFNEDFKGKIIHWTDLKY